MHLTFLGVLMPFGEFVRQTWEFLFGPMLPLFAIASLAQVVFLVRKGVFADYRAWRVGFAILLAPLLSLFWRLVLYVFMVRDLAPFTSRESVSTWPWTFTSNAFLATLLGYGILTMGACWRSKQEEGSSSPALAIDTGSGINQELWSEAFTSHMRKLGSRISEQALEEMAQTYHRNGALRDPTQVAQEAFKRFGV